MRIIIFTVLMLGLMTDKSLGQEFFPTNLKSLISIEKTGDKNTLKPNDYFLNEKEFVWVDDLLFVNKKTAEKVKFSSKMGQDKEEIRVDYYSTVKDLSRFIKRAGESGLKKISENRFEHKDKNATVSIEIKRNLQEGGKSYHLLSLVVIEDFTNGRAAVNNSAIKFPAVYSYPLQNTTYYFDTDIRDDKSYSDEYFINIKLAKTPKYGNKIVFLDDVNWKIILANKQTFTGTYTQSTQNRQIVSIGFNVTAVAPKVPKGYMKPIAETGALYNANELKKSKHDAPYYKFFFTKSYDLRFNGNDLSLSGKHYENYPTIAVPSGKGK